MDEREVPREGVRLREQEGLLSPPYLAQPYQCATAVTVYGFVPHATIDVEVGGVVVVTQLAGFPLPVGATLPLPAPLVAGEAVRVRQTLGTAQSPWSNPVPVLDHTKEFPAGPPRPAINPAPVFECGIRTGVGNLIAGGNVWITADGTQVGRVDGCNPQQGVNVFPAYGFNQRVRAWFELCGDPSAPSIEHIAQKPPSPLPAPGFDPIHEGGEQLVINNIVNGAAVTLLRNGIPVGTWGCWGGKLQVGLSPAFSAADFFTATQRMCPGDPESPPGGGPVLPCASLPAPRIGPVQGGDTYITVTSAAPSATIRVWVNGVHAATGSAPLVFLAGTVLKIGDVVHVVQELRGCLGATALEVKVACVDPPVAGNPAALDLFPVGHTEYSDGGAVKGSVYYPAEEDGEKKPFNKRLASLGRTPVVFMAHGNHDPADPSYLGYDYFQADLAKMGIIAVSVDCNALNGVGGGVKNIEDRADLIIESIRHFQSLDAAASLFFQRIDFNRLGLMGHSRGGDAVVTLPTVLTLSGVTIRGVLALAPTNFRFWSGLSTIRPKGYAFMTILPAGDGDVIDNNGAQFYDQAVPGPYKSQLYVHFTNHNFFNRQWLFDDGAGPAVVARSEHERILTTYGCAFLRNVLLGHDTAGYLAGDRKPTGVLSSNVYLSFLKQGQTTVDHHDEGNGIGLNSLGLPTAQSGGLSADEFPFAQLPGAFNGSFFGLTIGMVARQGGPARLFRSEIGDMDLRRKEIWIRAAEVVASPGSVPSGASGFQLGLEDMNGITAFVDVDMAGGLPRPYPHPVSTKSLLNTIRFKADCFKSPQGRLKLSNVRALLIACNRRDERAVAFDDLQIVKP